jgi:hypothetical protein
MGTTEYRIAREPAGERYKSLIDAGLQHGTILVLVVRSTSAIGENARRLLARLDRHLIDTTHRSAWPGTKLLDATAIVYRYAFNFECAEILKDVASRLYDWVHPELPEDPCILRRDGTEWLVTISHECFACLELSDEELEEFKSKAPSLVKALRKDEANPL